MVFQVISKIPFHPNIWILREKTIQMICYDVYFDNIYQLYNKLQKCKLHLRSNFRLSNHPALIEFHRRATPNFSDIV